MSQTAEDFDYYFVTSWDQTLIFDAVHHQHTAAGGSILAKGSPRLANVRCQEVLDYLSDPKYDHCHWFFSIDSDMGWEMDSLCRLLGTAYGGREDADPDDPTYHVVGGLCFAGGPTECKPTVYGAEQAEDGAATTTIVWDYPKDAVCEVAGTGAAFLLIHRKVLLHMVQPHPHGFGTFPDGTKNPTPWFAEGIEKGREFGEDIAFCQRARALGYKIAVDTSVKVTHWKKLPLDEYVYDARRYAMAHLDDPNEQRFIAEALAHYRRNRPTPAGTVADGMNRAERRRAEREARKGQRHEHSGGPGD